MNKLMQWTVTVLTVVVIGLAASTAQALTTHWSPTNEAHGFEQAAVGTTVVSGTYPGDWGLGYGTGDGTVIRECSDLFEWSTGGISYTDGGLTRHGVRVIVWSITRYVRETDWLRCRRA